MNQNIIQETVYIIKKIIEEDVIMKKTFKRLMAVGLVCLMMTSVIACGKNNSGSDPTKAPTSTTSPSSNPDSSGDSTDDDTGDVSEPSYDFGGVTVKAWGGSWGDLDKEDNLAAQEAKAYVEEKYNIVLEKAKMEGSDGSNEDEILLSSIQAGDPATDIICLNPELMVSLFLNDALHDITHFYKTLEIGSSYTNVATWQGKVYGVSYDNIGDCWVMIYDRQLLKNIGMEKTPTEIFMEGNWDYNSFKAYLTEMKSKLPEGTYPIGNYPYHWAVMAAGANGAQLVDSNGQIDYTNEAVIEALEFYQQLEEEGLAYPMGTTTNDEGTIVSDIAYAIDDTRIVLKRAEPWQLGGIEYDYGIVLWPWGSNVTCGGDYTTLSDNYNVQTAYWAFDSVVSASINKLGISGEILTLIIKDYRDAYNTTGEWMHEAWESEQDDDVNTQVGAEWGEARNFYSQEDIALYDWAHTRSTVDWSWAFDSADLVDIWVSFRDILRDYKDTRSTLESYQNSGVASLEEAGIPQTKYKR